MNIIQKIFQSSEGEGLAKRWETLFSASIPTLVFLSNIFDLGLVKADFSELQTITVSLISAIIIVWKSGQHLEGWFRRNFNKKNRLGKFAK